MTRSPQPIACTAGPQLQRQRVAEWRALLAHVDLRDSLPAGIRVSFNPSAPLPELIRLTAADGYLVIPEAATGLDAGAEVSVTLYG